MENNEVMVAEDVIETAVEIVKKKPKVGVTIAIATGGLAVLGIIVYKTVIKPRREKKKAEKAEAEATVNAYKRKKIDTTDDKSIDVYADDEAEKTEE